MTTTLRDACGVTAANRRDVPYANGTLPTYCFPANHSRGTIVAFGGFESYTEEFFPMLLSLRDKGWSVVAIGGPGQGAAPEERHFSMTPHWHNAVGAVLDGFSLHDVTVLGNLPLAVRTINEWLMTLCRNPAHTLSAVASGEIPDTQQGKRRLPDCRSQAILLERGWRDLSSNTTSSLG